MKHNHVLDLLQTNYTTVEVSFPSYQSSPRTYTYKVPLDAGIQVGDNCVVLVRDELKVVKIEVIHAQPSIDTSSAINYKWIVSKVDRTAYDAQREKEQQFLKLMQDMERARVRDSLAEALLRDMPEGGLARQLFDSALAAAGISLPKMPTAASVPTPERCFIGSQQPQDIR